MNKVNFYCTLYGYLRNYGMPYWVLTPVRRCVRYIVSKRLPQFLSKPSVSNSAKVSEVVVSFTSFPARIKNVWQVVECMLRQELMPKKILLWLSKEQFPNMEGIPKRLLMMQNNIFEIRMVDGDIRSHKKYLYVSQEFSSSPVLLIDDDIYYPTDFVKRFFEASKVAGEVIARYGYIIQYKSDGTVDDYSHWKQSYRDTDDVDFFFGSGGGVLFYPSLMYKDLTNISLAMELCPTADDIWLNAMVLLSGQKKHQLKSGPFLPIRQDINNITLAADNVVEKRNDAQIMSLNDYYQKKIGKKVFGR